MNDFARIAAELDVSPEELREAARWVMTPDRRRSTITVRAPIGRYYGPRSDSLLYRLAEELEVEPSYLRDVILRVKQPAPGRVATVAFTHVWSDRHQQGPRLM